MARARVHRLSVDIFCLFSFSVSLSWWENERPRKSLKDKMKETKCGRPNARRNSIMQIHPIAFHPWPTTGNQASHTLRPTSKWNQSHSLLLSAFEKLFPFSSRLYLLKRIRSHQIVFRFQTTRQPEEFICKRMSTEKERKDVVWNLPVMEEVPAAATTSLWTCFMCSIKASLPRKSLWHKEQHVVLGPPIRAACCLTRVRKRKKKESLEMPWWIDTTFQKEKLQINKSTQ